MDSVRNTIKDKVKQIENEVKELHPLLEALFNKMPNVTNVEYTHGSREYGADFVISAKHELLDEMQHIGVIAKIGKIVQGDPEVTRQIEECITMPRVILGKDKITISEVWVVSSKNITSNAQDFFSEKYASTKIKFVSGERLASMLSKHLDDYWDNYSIEIGVYLGKTKETLSQLEAAAALNLSNLEGFELEQDLCKIQRISYAKEASEPKHNAPKINIFQILNKNHSFLIEGPMGSGKSSLLRKAALHYCNTDVFSKEKLLPIFTTVKELKDYHNDKICSLIEKTTKENSIEDNTIRYIVFLDGLDEIKQSQTEISERIERYFREACSFNSQIVLTCRKNTEPTNKTLVTASIDRYEIQPLSMKKIISLIERSCSTLNVRNKILQDLTSSNLFRLLPRTPIAAVLLAKLIKENQKDIPSNLPELYSKYTEIALGRWDIEKGIQSQKEYDVIRSILLKISKYMIDNDLSVISKNDAMGFFKDYLEKRKTDLKPESLFNSFVKRCEIVVTNDEKNTFGFKHRTFCEFFYAQTMSNNDAFKNQESFEIYWATVNYFYVGMVKDCAEIIDRFTALKPTCDRTRFLKIYNSGNYLLAAHQTEYTHISESLNALFIEAGKQFCDIKNKKTNSPLEKFSEMQLLSVFRYIMSDGYSYDFLKQAIEESLITVEEDKFLSDEEKSIVLFLLNTAYISLDGENIFDGMISKLGGNIPLSIQLAIQHEANAAGLSSGKLNKLYRNMKKLLSNRGEKKILDTLYDMPIKKLSVR